MAIQIPGYSNIVTTFPLPAPHALVFLLGVDSMAPYFDSTSSLLLTVGCNYHLLLHNPHASPVIIVYHTEVLVQHVCKSTPIRTPKQPNLHAQQGFMLVTDDE